MGCFSASLSVFFLICFRFSLEVICFCPAIFLLSFLLENLFAQLFGESSNVFWPGNRFSVFFLLKNSFFLQKAEKTVFEQKKAEKLQKKSRKLPGET